MRNTLNLLFVLVAVTALLVLHSRSNKAYLNGQLDSCRKIVGSLSYGTATCTLDAGSNQVVIFNAGNPELKYTLDGQPIAPTQTQVAPQQEQQ